ncbi:MAG TPA: hypothetical protein VGV36_07615, partial [Solirubrobacteraceae bacterium]|nr:hypothetical protein [Solirubrobacteraceae bacterium]
MTSGIRLLTVLALVALGLGLAACGSEGPTTQGESEAVYVDVGELKYQVQTSRQLNPTDAGDRAYLVGLPPEERQLAPGETFFGVWIRVENETHHNQPAATHFEVVDARENVYEPIALAPGNAFGYS